MWDYPRPPIVVPSTDRVRVVHAGRVVADTTSAMRVLETSQPPAFYVPRADIDTAVLVPGTGRSLCEWKGLATYWSLLVDGVLAPDVACSLALPAAAVARMEEHRVFYE